MNDALASALAERYQIERELGQGGMATVYLAQDVRHQRRVALKVLRPELAAIIGADRFIQEIRTTANLQHPNILSLFDSGSAGTFLYYVMPFIEGETLRDRLTRETQLGVDEAIRITREVADALDYAHRQGVIHRDIKPENILLHNGRPIIADFGIALAVSSAAGGRMTETGLSLGTPHYMSPEQATAQKELSARSDIYSLAAVLYEMLAGEPPHTGATPQVIMMKIITDEAPPVTKLRRTVPPHVDAAIAKALERLPADRFETIAAFGNALVESGQTVSRTARTAAIRGAPTAARRRTMEFVLGAALVGVGALAAWGWMRPTAAVVTTGAPWRVSIVLPDSAAPDNGVSLSDDGSMLVYGGRGPRGRQLWVRRAGSADATPIPGTDDGSYPVLSPNGQRIAFHQSNRLVVAPLEGGQAIPIVDDLAFEDWAAWIDNDRLVVPSWSGLKQVTLSDAGVTSVDSAQWVSRVDSAAGEGGHGYPAPLSDGQGVVFTVYSQKDWTVNGAQIAVAPLGGQPHTVLMPGLWARYAEPGHLLVTQGNGSIVAVPFDVRTRKLTGAPRTVVTGLPVGSYSSSGGFSVSRSGRIAFVAGDALERSDLVRVSRTGEATPLDTSWSGTFLGVALSADGKRTAVSMRTLNADEVRVRDLASGGTTRIAVAGMNPLAPSFSSDGMTVVFAGIGSTKHGLYRAAIGASAPPALMFETSQHVLLDSPALAPDGQTLYYTAYSGASGDLHAKRLDALQDTTSLRVGGTAYEGFPAPSPDGTWLAYVSNETGRLEVYVRPTDESRAERWQVSRSGVARTAPRWSRDGRELYYLARDSVVAARIANGATFTIVEQRSLFAVTPYRSSFDVFPDGSFLMIRPRPLAPGALEVSMLDRWQGSGAR